MRRLLTVGVASELLQQWQFALYAVADDVQAYMYTYGIGVWPELQYAEEYSVGHARGWRLTFAWPDGIGRHDGH